MVARIIKKEVLTKEIKFTKEGKLSLKKGESDSIIAQLDIEFAEGEYETQTGLMYRTGMEQTQGMLLFLKGMNHVLLYEEYPIPFGYNLLEFAI